MEEIILKTKTETEKYTFKRVGQFKLSLNNGKSRDYPKPIEFSYLHASDEPLTVAGVYIFMSIKNLQKTPVYIGQTKDFSYRMQTYEFGGTSSTSTIDVHCKIYEHLKKLYEEKEKYMPVYFYETKNNEKPIDVEKALIEYYWATPQWNMRH